MIEVRCYFYLNYLNKQFRCYVTFFLISYIYSEGRFLYFSVYICLLGYREVRVIAYKF